MLIRLGLKRRRYRTAGVRVPATTYRLIQAADTARGTGDWQAAAIRYREVLASRPDLIHIRVQLGHALGQIGDAAAAEREYRIAHGMDPSDRDAALHLGHVLKSLGLWDQAARSYVALVRRDRDDEEAMREARNALGQLTVEASGDLVAELMALLPPVERAAVERGDDEPHEIVYDVTDLLAYFGHSRLPTGIQRVQLEVLLVELGDEGSGRAGVCCFIEGRQEWVAIPSIALVALIRASVAEGDPLEPDWRYARDRLWLFLLGAQPVRFATGATLINLGTSWWVPNYFLRLRDARTRRAVRYVTMIYDLIPVLHPDFFDDLLVQDFVGWLTGVLDHADGYLAISQSTKRDLLAIASAAGRPIDPAAVAVVPLDADLRAKPDAGETAILPIEAQREPFVLFVATVEPRKGHLVAFDAWLALMERLPATSVPRLICVGRRGWCSAAVYAKLDGHPMLRDRVTLLSGINDVTLAALYERCLFTIYPSLYEGWGLPVSEALCRGKVVVTTTSSSLPEAGGEFAVYVPPADADALASAVARLVEHDDERIALEARILVDYRPRGWQEIARQVVVEIRDFERRRRDADEAWLPPIATPDVFYWLGKSFATELGRQIDGGEMFRAGLGWRSPEAWGCRTLDDGGKLACRLPPIMDRRDLVLVLRLVGSTHAVCPYRIATPAGVVDGMLARHEHRTVRIALGELPVSPLRVTIAGSTARDGSVGDPPVVRETVGVAGFMVHLAAAEDRATPDLTHRGARPTIPAPSMQSEGLGE